MAKKAGTTTDEQTSGAGDHAALVTTDAATEVATVDVKMPWKILMPGSRRWAASASSSPITSPAGTV